MRIALPVAALATLVASTVSAFALEFEAVHPLIALARCALEEGRGFLRDRLLASGGGKM